MASHDPVQRIGDMKGSILIIFYSEFIKAPVNIITDFIYARSIG